MAAKKNKNIGHWIPGEEGYDTTKSLEIIKVALANIKKKRMFVVLLQKGYQSGSTIIVDFDDKHLLIDKPMDWPGSNFSVRVVFKDEAMVWNHFTVKVVGVYKDTLKTIFPTELFRLQRRSHFRINVPRGSEASFGRKDWRYTDGAMVDISVGGMLLRFDRLKPIVDGHSNDKISHIVLTILPGPGEPSDEAVALVVEEGRIVREMFDQQSKCLMVGVKFSLKVNEEKDLMQYVRQRELALLRKGLK